eukprot:scaffold19280_cov46-Phaeocystis_antarctica.AAC.2
MGTCAGYYGQYNCAALTGASCSCSECCTDVDGAQLPTSPSPPLQPSPLAPPSLPPSPPLQPSPLPPPSPPPSPPLPPSPPSPPPSVPSPPLQPSPLAPPSPPVPPPLPLAPPSPPAVNYTACRTACGMGTCAGYYGQYTCAALTGASCSCSECCTDVDGAQLPEPTSPSPPLQPSPPAPPSPPASPISPLAPPASGEGNTTTASPLPSPPPPSPPPSTPPSPPASPSPPATPASGEGNATTASPLPSPPPPLPSPPPPSPPPPSPSPPSPSPPPPAAAASPSIGCYTGNGADYRGEAATTASGVPCQKWSSQFPQSHTNAPEDSPGKGLESNYCRNPDGETSPWCYLSTTDGARFEYCTQIPQCPSPPSTSPPPSPSPPPPLPPSGEGDTTTATPPPPPPPASASSPPSPPPPSPSPPAAASPLPPAPPPVPSAPPASPPAENVDTGTNKNTTDGDNAAPAVIGTIIGLLVLLGLITAAVRWYRSHAPHRTGMMPRMTHEIEFEAFRPLSSQ